MIHPELKGSILNSLINDMIKKGDINYKHIEELKQLPEIVKEPRKYTLYSPSEKYKQ